MLLETHTRPATDERSDTVAVFEVICGACAQKVFFFIIIFKEALIAVMLAALPLRVRQEKLARENLGTPNGEKVTQQSLQMRRAEESLTFSALLPLS